MVEEESRENNLASPGEVDQLKQDGQNPKEILTDASEIIKKLGRTKKRILIELYRDSVGYKRLSKIIGVGLDTVRSHIRTGKYSRSLLELGLVERGEKGWQLTPLGLQVTELLQQDKEFKAFFFE